MVFFSDTLRAEIHRAVKELQASPYMVYTWTTGAALGIQKLLWETPGASDLLIGGYTSYSKTETQRRLGRKVASFTSFPTVIGMANVAYLRGLEDVSHAGSLAPVIGAAASCAVETVHERRGEDKIYLASAKVGGEISIAKVGFKKGAHSREEQGLICDLLVLNAICTAAGVNQVRLPKTWAIESAEHLRTLESEEVELATELHNQSQQIKGMLERHDMIFISPEGKVTSLIDSFSPQDSVLFSGSFNPLHHGHEHVAEAGALETGKQVTFELSTSNADKDGSDLEEVIKRSYQMLGKWGVIVSLGNPRFVDKCQAYPKGTEFLLGADTLSRLLQSETSWAESEEELNKQLQAMSERNARLHILNRREGKEVVRLKDVLEALKERSLPNYLLAKDLCNELAGIVNISSSELRKSLT